MVPQLELRALDADSEGWQEVVLIQGDPGDPEGEPEGDTVGHLRVVEDTVGGPHVWWDARVFVESGQAVTRRFMAVQQAMLSMALRAQHEDRDTRRALGW